jgi:hypothetical protein
MPEPNSKLCLVCSTPFEDCAAGNKLYCHGNCKAKASRDRVRKLNLCAWCGKPTIAATSCRVCAGTKVHIRETRRQAGLCWHCGAEKPSDQPACYRCTEHTRLSARRKNAALRKQVLDIFGNRCNCCGESRPEFLSLDHINGRTAEEKRRGPSSNSYRAARREGYPRDKYRLLCYNCNCSRGFLGYCPHEREREQVA